MDSPSADEKVEKGEDGAGSQEEGTSEDHGEESGVLSKRESHTEPQEEKKSKKPRRESRWDSDKEWSKYANQKIVRVSFKCEKPIFVLQKRVQGQSSAASCRSSLLGSAPAGLPPLQSTLIVQQQPGQSVYVQQQVGVQSLLTLLEYSVAICHLSLWLLLFADKEHVYQVALVG